MSELKVEVDPADAGLDVDRLGRIDSHFKRYVDDGRLPGVLITVSRNGRIAHVSRYGSRDSEAALPVEPDTLWRIYSMTKPVTSVAAMMLYEEGAFELTDPVSKFIPAFAGMRVYTGGSDLRPVTVPATEPVRIWHLLTHTAGLTYGFHRVHPADAMHRAAGFDLDTSPGLTLAQACDAWAAIPLLFEPGAEWNYSVATDVLGRMVEVASGQPLDEFFTTCQAGWTWRSSAGRCTRRRHFAGLASVSASRSSSTRCRGRSPARSARCPGAARRAPRSG